MEKEIYCDYTEEETDNMSEKQLEKLSKCGNFNCFECYGDSFQEY